MLILLSFSGCGAGKEEAPVNTEENTASVAADEKTTAESEAESATEAEKTTENEETSEETTAAEPGNFFDGAVFVGDSVTMGLRNYVVSERNKGRECLGEAAFLTEGSMGYTNTVQPMGTVDSIHPRYKGEEMYIEDALALMEPEKVFIMLGMNDFCIYAVEKGIGNAQTLIDRIKEKNPETDIYIESVTPVDRDRGDFNNENIDEFNAALKKFCKENDCTYVDVASVMKNADGALIKSYCSDPAEKGVHMTFAGCRAWVNYLNKSFNKGK